jgi:ubiquinone/menaquinone biosynthesis C-methylase UbiE
MKPGDFTQLAEAYAHRPAYSETVVDALFGLLQASRPPVVADVGAGTGKFTAMLDGRGATGFAVEPNDAMRAQGRRLDLVGFHWVEGRAEATGLASEAVDWVTMASAFHWAEASRALEEFHRILRPGGRLVLLWNPRDLDHDPLQARIEARIAEIAPQIRRRSSGAAAYTADLESVLLGSGLFEDLLFLEAPHVERMSRERHMGAWRSVNDIQAQAGMEAWTRILAAIEAELGEAQDVAVRYRTRAWTVRKA